MTIRLFTQGDLKHIQADERALLIWFVLQYATGNFSATSWSYKALPEKRRSYILQKWDDRDGWGRYRPTYAMALAALGVCEDAAVADQINAALARANVLNNEVFWPGLAEYEAGTRDHDVSLLRERQERIASGRATIDEMLTEALGQAIDDQFLNGTGGA